LPAGQPCERIADDARGGGEPLRQVHQLLQARNYFLEYHL